MSNLEYKDKYLKYKNKYLYLKNELESQNKSHKLALSQTQLSNQQGGNTFSSGQYIFFLNEYQADPDKYGNLNKYPNSTFQYGEIDDFDKFTNELGQCAYFIRIGKTTTGYDLTHSYDTIYPNRTNLSIIGDSFGDKLGSFIEGIGNFFVGNSSGETNNKESKIDDDKSNTAVSVGGGLKKQFEIKYLCYYRPIPLANCNIGMTMINSENISIANLTKIINTINKQIYTKKGGNQINTVLIITKLSSINNFATISKNYKVVSHEDVIKGEIIIDKIDKIEIKDK